MLFVPNFRFLLNFCLLGAAGLAAMKLFGFAISWGWIVALAVLPVVLPTLITLFWVCLAMLAILVIVPIATIIDFFDPEA